MLLKFAVKEFIAEKKFQNLSAASISAYKYTLEEFAENITKWGTLNLGEVTSKDVRDYLKHCREERNNGPVTLNHKLNNLRIFFKFMIGEGVITKSPAETLKPLRTDIRIDTFTDQQIELILGHFRRQRRRKIHFTLTGTI